MKFRDKIAVITGAAGGIGSATCRQLIAEGIGAIGAVDRDERFTLEVCRQFNSEAGREVMQPFVGSVTDADFRRSVYADLKKRFGVVHICVPAAGITRDALAVKVNKATGQSEMYPITDFQAVMDINLTAPIYWALETIAAVAEYRFRQGLGRWEPTEETQGSIVLIGSVSSTGNKGQISYATAKAGLEGAQSTLAKEAIYYGVRCNIIHPGFTDTPMVRALGEELIQTQILPNTQLRRLLRPDEVADAICFMLRSSAVSGSLWVDAGWAPVN